MRKKISKLILMIATAILLGSCATGAYHPRGGQGVQTEAGFALIRTDSLLVAVRPRAYPNSSNTFAQRFFSVAIHVRNLSSRPQSISSASFSILADGMQYDYIPLSLVLGNLRNYNLLNRDDLFTDFDPIPDLGDPYDKEQEYALELINSYFSFGDLLPGGRKEGYLFYNINIAKSRSIQIEALGHSFVFDYRK